MSILPNPDEAVVNELGKAGDAAELIFKFGHVDYPPDLGFYLVVSS